MGQIVDSNKQAFLQALLDRMSVEDKAGQLNFLTGSMDVTGMKRSEHLEQRIREGRCGAVLNVYSPAATRALQQFALASPLQIPLAFGYDVIHGHRTIFPIPLGMACSWNLDLIGDCARAAATEAAADGLHWVFSPMVDISQDPRWGRVADGAGEDPWLASKIAAAMVRGYQGKNLTDAASVAACVKHIALYGASQSGRDYHTVDMSRREMEETYFPPYQAAIDAGARTAMAAFNVVDGVPATGNAWLLTDMLRHRWKFRGLLVSDFNAIAEMLLHGTAADNAEAAKQALAAGIDMDMMSDAYLTEIPGLLDKDEISMPKLDDAVLRVLEFKWDLGLFDDPYARCDEARAKAVHLCSAHRGLARQAARESIVLLKNDGALLPLARQGAIAVIGPLADNRRDLLGCWHAAGNDDSAVSALAALSAAAGNARIIFAPGCGIDTGDRQQLDEAERAAEEADVVILIVGESREMSGEAASRVDIRLPKCQRKLAKRIFKTGKPVVLVSISGRPLELSKEATRFPAMLHAFAPGMEGGNALADLIFGDAAPLAKLAMGFPRAVGQLPMTYREHPSGRPFDPGNPYTSRYLDCGNDALFPFGHGLTYGAVEIGTMTISPSSMPAGGQVSASVELANHGPAPVTETVQLYLRDPVASFSRPVKELRGYQRVTLAAGESRTISFEITDAELRPNSQAAVEPGEFVVMIGTSSGKLRESRFWRI